VRRHSDRGTALDHPTGEHIGAEAAAMDEALHNGAGREGGRGKCSTQAAAGLAQLDASHSDRSHQELNPDECIEAYTASEDVSMGDGHISRSSILKHEGFDLFDLDEREILARLVVKPEVTIAFDARAGDDTNEVMFDLGVTRPRGGKDSLDFHGKSVSSL
jgi:hypothetical protein